MTGSATDRVERFFDKHAQRYDRQILFFERHVLGQHRQWATEQARGRVLELAVGTGLNLPLYPQAVTHVLGIELSAQMAGIAQRRVVESDLLRIAEVRVGDVQDLAEPDACFDTAVSTYTLCTVPDPEKALREAHRVLKPGGRLVLVEHGPATRAPVRTGQRLLNPITARIAADHLLRDAAQLAAAAGFTVTSADHAGWAGIVQRVTATRP